VAPRGENGTSMRTGFDGHVCATAQSDTDIAPANIASLCNMPMDSPSRHTDDYRGGD
jgi:hypothetical protein